MPRLVIVGGGITGLAAALFATRYPDLEVTLVEASDRMGGKIETTELGDARIELGADAFLPRDETPLRLCREIGIQDELVEPADFGGWVYRAGELRRLPAGTVLGFPASLKSLQRADILSPAGKARAAAEVLSRRPLTGPDVSVAEFTRGRFGPEVLDRLVDPLLAGTRAGSVEEMSLAAAVPPVDAAARSHRSTILGLGRRQVPAAVRPRFFSPRTGMSRLIEALEGSCRNVDLRRGTPARSLHVRGRRSVLELDDGSLEADALVLATPAHVAAPLVRSVSAEAADGLGSMGFSSSAVVNLLFPPGSITLPDGGGSGVLIPSSMNMTLSGCTWFSSKWPALASSGGSTTIRCFVGRGERDPALDLSDDDLVGIVLNELLRLIDVHDDPTASHVKRWDLGMPRYTVGHLDRLARTEALLRAEGPLMLAGSSYRGTGIPDCIAQAGRAVEAVAGALRG